MKPHPKRPIVRKFRTDSGSSCRFELELPSAPREISKVESFLQTANEDLGLDDGTMYRLLVAATEAVNNAILHGNQSDPSKRVHLCLRTTVRYLILRVTDEGSGFDPDILPSPLDDQNLLKEHGRGVFLIKSLIDNVEFVKLKHGSAAVLKIRLDRLK